MKTLTQVARLLNVDRSTVWRDAHLQRMGKRIGNMLVFTQSEIDRLKAMRKRKRRCGKTGTKRWEE